MAAFVKMPFIRLPKILRNNPQVKSGHVSALIWTTTPWTLPANKAVAVHEDVEYTIIEMEDPTNNPALEGQLLVAKTRIEHVLSHLRQGVTTRIVVDSITGSQLADGSATCYNLFQGKESPLVSADFVTATSGTGLVHMAPGHGMEDYQVCQQYGIGPAFAPVDAAGHYTDEVFPVDTRDSQLTGLDAQTGGAKCVLNILSSAVLHLPSTLYNGSSLLLASHSFTHKNPIDWRTKQPVIVRATAQWFADVSAITERSLASLEKVTFIPESGKNRLGAFVSGRSQWCISRQRAWGVPIPALYHKITGEACISDESIAHIIDTLEQRGTDAWFADPIDDPVWFHSSLEAGMWVRGADTMDVWFDSGTTWTTLQRRDDGKPPSDVYLEGTDQHRGWFQSSLLTTIATQEVDAPPRAPYEKLITHGFILDAEGRKMSKSIGNVISPDEIVAGTLLPPLKQKKGKKNKDQATKSSTTPAQPEYDSMGPDVLRLWVASSDYTRDVSIAVPVLQEVQQALQKYRVTFKFLLGVLADLPQPHERSDDPLYEYRNELTFADKAILGHLSRTLTTIRGAYDDYQFHKVVKELNNLVYNDLSAFYFEVCKDRLYAGSDEVRRRTQGVLYVVFQTLLQMLGPIVPHLVEEVWEHIPLQLKSKTGDIEMDRHPLRQTWPSFDTYSSSRDWTSNSIPQLPGNSFSVFSSLSNAVKVAQEDARRAGHLRSGLACEVVIHRCSVVANDARFSHLWGSFADELRDLLVVSAVECTLHDQSMADFEDFVKAEAGRSPPQSGARGWRFTQSVNLDYGGGEHELMLIEVRPPSAQKCVRCWRFTAEEDNVPCGRCRDVLEQQGYTK